MGFSKFKLRNEKTDQKELGRHTGSLYTIKYASSIYDKTGNDKNAVSRF